MGQLCGGAMMLCDQIYRKTGVEASLDQPRLRGGQQAAGTKNTTALHLRARAREGERGGHAEQEIV